MFHFGILRDPVIFNGWTGHFEAGKAPHTSEGRVAWLPKLLRGVAFHHLPELCGREGYTCDTQVPKDSAKPESKINAIAPLNENHSSESSKNVNGITVSEPLAESSADTSGASESTPYIIQRRNIQYQRHRRAPFKFNSPPEDWSPIPDLITAQSSLWDFQQWLQESIYETNEALMAHPNRMEDWVDSFLTRLVNPIREVYPTAPLVLRTCPLTSEKSFFPRFAIAKMNEVIVALSASQVNGIRGVLNWDRLVRGWDQIELDGFHQSEKSIFAYAQMLLSELELLHVENSL
jgi:hypothetical protein